MDREWRPLPVKRRYPVFEPGEPRPVTYETMVRCAETLAQDCPFMRVDFYEVDGHLYFSEITLFPGSGFERFYPKQWDEYWGERLSLPNR